jgi:hypothetical protein
MEFRHVKTLVSGEKITDVFDSFGERIAVIGQQGTACEIFPIAGLSNVDRARMRRKGVRVGLISVLDSAREG